MNKLTEEEGKKLYEFLKYLKALNWQITIENAHDIGKIFDWHLKLTGYISAYDAYDCEMQLNYMIKDIIAYFKEPVKNIEKIKCKKCRKLKTKDYFFKNNICRDCRKKV